MANQGAAHTALLRQALAAIGALPGVIAALNPCGKATYVSDQGKTFYTPYGWPCPGGPDILVVVAPRGRALGLEGKTGQASLSKAQAPVHRALEAVGMPVVVFHSPEEAVRAVEAVRAGRWPLH